MMRLTEDQAKATIIEARCAVCARQFAYPRSWHRGGRRKYCSHICASEARRKPTSACETCGAAIARYARRFCSHACSAKARETKFTRQCAACGAPFTVKPSEARGTLGRFCSQKCVGALKAKEAIASTHLTAKGGRRADLDNRYFRSRWEANYARYLNFLQANSQIARWEYEPDTFEFDGIQRGSRFYTPDFKVFDFSGGHAYHEVKGYLTQQGRTKLKRMAKYHPNERVVLIAREQYRAVALQVAKLVPNWETSNNKGRYL